MADYIKREDLVNALLDYTWRDEEGYMIDDYDGKRRFIEEWMPDIPAADVRENVRGEWIDTTNYFMRWQCSVCENHTRDARPPYCPYCGAEMRGA